MPDFLTYLYRVYIPKFSKDRKSYSTYPKNEEFWTQVTLWSAFFVFLGILAYHVTILSKCNSQYRADICVTLFYSWGFYSIALAVVLTMGMLLHYAYVDPENQTTPDADTSDEDEIESPSSAKVHAADDESEDIN